MPFWKTMRVTPAQIIITSFLLLILLGALLLMLPFASRQPGSASFLDALFTATSATCVTGLVVHDTVQYWTPFGQAVILLLIQIGGIGVVTMAVVVFIFSGRKIGLKQRWVMQESISAPQVGGIVRMTNFIVKTALCLEAAGACFLAIRFCPQFGLLRGMWYAVFHAVSAFCNAGFDLMGTDASYVSLTAYLADPLVNGVIMLLIITGGLGFVTWQDVSRHGIHLGRYRLQSKLILITTLFLLLGGFLYFFLFEFRLPQWQALSLQERTLAAMFQSVTPRTAGFNSVDLTNLSPQSQLVTILLMLCGGAPGSTAGGFKITTLAVLVLGTLSVFRRSTSAYCFGRRLPENTLLSAAAIFILYLVLFLVGGLLISCLDGISLMYALFESASAIGTVGLSLEGTASLGAASKAILIFLMYFGRVGGLTMIYAVAASNAAAASQYPMEQVTVG